jgi:predicted O-methyltransferase YrrM
MQNDSMEFFLEEKKLLDNMAEGARREKIPVVDKITGRFLELICLIKNPENILEVGCGIGFSSYFLVKNLGDGSYTGIDLNKKRLEKAEEFLKFRFKSGNLSLLNGNALEIIPYLKRSFDLVFIDGAKLKYPFYIKTVENKLNDGAIIIADNIFFKNKVFEENVSRHDSNSVKGIREYIRYITTKKCFKSYFFDIGDGILVTEFFRGVN